MRKYSAGQGATDEVLAKLPELTHLDCGLVENFTDKGLRYIPNLTYLNCGINKNFTDAALKNIETVWINM
jgi:hypothetical protein